VWVILDDSKTAALSVAIPFRSLSSRTVAPPVFCPTSRFSMGQRCRHTGRATESERKTETDGDRKSAMYLFLCLKSILEQDAR
jgi:hypothetical protein